MSFKSVAQQKFLRVLILTMPLALVACGSHKGDSMNADTIPILSVEGAEDTTLYESNENLIKGMAHVADEAVTSIDKSLNTLDVTAPSDTELSTFQQTPSKKKLRLTTVVVGVGFSGSIGFGPISMSLDPKLRFGFANTENYTLP